MADAKIRAARASLRRAQACGSTTEMRRHVREALQLLEAVDAEVSNDDTGGRPN